MAPRMNPEQGNRRGCIVMVIGLLLVLLLFGWLSTRTNDAQQSNETLSEAPSP